jgi:DNA-binding GntR family transcriptional regulator
MTRRSSDAKKDGRSFLASRVLPTSREDFVYETLKEAILTGQFKPGEEISQTSVASQLGVSPIPVRAAIARLAAEGLISQEAHHSPRISALSPDALEEALVIRMHLEVLATRLAIPFVSSGDLAELHALVGEMEQALASADPHRYSAVNKAFHLRLYRCCPNALLQQMIRDLWNKTDLHRSRSMFALVPGLSQHSHRDHLELLRLIEAGDCDGAAELIQLHKTRARERFIETIREHPLGG